MAERSEIGGPKLFRGQLALTKEFVLREWLAEIIPPRRQIVVRVRFNILIDIRRGRKCPGIASNVYLVFRLVDPDIIDSHGNWELYVLEVYCAEIRRHPHISDDVHRFLRDSPSTDLGNRIGTYASAQ